MREVQIKELVKRIVRESFKQSISEETYQFGKKSYTDKKLSPSEILDLATAYINTPITKISGSSLGSRVYTANDLARLTGTIQQNVRIRSKQPALIMQTLKNGLITKDEYVKLYTELIKLQAKFITSYLQNASPENRNSSAAMRAAAKDGKDDFNFENVNEMGVNDTHFKNILRVYDHGGSFTKKKVAVAVCKNPSANRTKIIDYLKDMDYEEILQVEDELNIGESVSEGKKAFKVNPQIGRAKYSISSHNGTSTHKDGSDFWDIHIFKNKVDLEKAIKDYRSKGFIEESVNEAKYPTDLKIGSVIKGQGFTRLKGIDGGKYYKIVDMDDTTATLTRTDPSGKVSSPTKVRHKLDSIEGGIKTAKRGDENGIVVVK